MKTAIVTMTGRPGPDRSSLDWREAFCEGLRRKGWDASLSTTPEPCDLLVMWGIRKQDIIARQKAAGGEVCILERGYLGDRFAWTSVSLGGSLNGRARFNNQGMPGDRWGRHFGHLIQPWQTGGGYALLIGQVPGDQSIRGVNIEAFYQQSAAALRKYGWPDVRFRPHPKAGAVRGVAGIPVIGGTLHEAMAGAGLVMTYNSNTGVDAAMFGRPVIAMDRGSMAWDVAGHQVTEIVTPDRTAWAHNLAYCQWSMDEIARGEAWEHLEPIAQC
jgi:hypothetical protein